MEYKEEINRLAKEFESCQKILLALGDENRQHLILEWPVAARRFLASSTDSPS